MSDLPPPAPRRPLHTRRICFEGFLREDGLWDIDCELCDTKSTAIPACNGAARQAGEPLHHLRVRLTIDDGFTIRAVQTGVASVPYNECHLAAADPMQKLVGLTMGPGWRKQIEGAIGGVAGCTHYRELVFNAATAAFQMVPHQRAMERLERGEPPQNPDQPPFYMGKCMSWSFEGPVVQRFAPQFYRGKIGLKKVD